jgi:hypothetical protein
MVVDLRTHRRSSTMLRNMTIGNEYTPMRRLRQIASELQHKQQALVENKFKIQKDLQKAKIYRAKAAKESDPLGKDLLLIKAEEKEELVKLSKRPYLGALREVLQLTQLHDAIVEQMRQKYGKVDEEVFEKEEARYWIKRIFAQSLRYLRQQGTINTGNQEVLEQIGLDPVAIHNLLSEYLKDQAGRTEASSADLENFLEQCASRYHISVVEKAKRSGLPTETLTEHLFVEENTDE